MQVEVYYEGKLALNFEAENVAEARSRAARGGHAVTCVTAKGGAIRVLSKCPEGFVAVSDAELNAIRDEKVASGYAIFNGCTRVWLAERYGVNNTGHVLGVGFFRRKGARKIKSWDGMCPAKKHGLDYRRQTCGMCAAGK